MAYTFNNDFVAEVEQIVNNMGIGLISFRIAIPSSEVLQLNTVPKLLVSAPAAGKAIDLVSCYLGITFNTIAYDTNVSLHVYEDTAITPLRVFTQLDATASRITQGDYPTPATTADTQIIAVKGLYATVNTGNPANGNSDIVIYGTYRLITV